MSVFKRSRRRHNAPAGGAWFDAPNGTLPSANERVQHELERRGLGWGDGGETPMQEPQAPMARNRQPEVAYYDLRRTYGRPGSQRQLPFPAKRLGFSDLKKLRIKEPKVVLFCQQRRERREVLFAKKVAGYRRSPGRGGTYRRRAESQWRC